MSVDEDMLYESLHESWDEIDELKAENTRLQVLNRHLMKGNLLYWLTDADAYEQHKREREMQASIAELQAENAKLRELVRFMWLADYAGHFSTLPELQEHQAVVWQRMCELGVEV